MALLSRLLVPVLDGNCSPQGGVADPELIHISRTRFDEVLALAESNHVVMRGLEVFLAGARQERDATRQIWAEHALAAERKRIETAIALLGAICDAFAESGLDVAVIKSLDHWPDLGSDLDLYTDANSDQVCALMKRRFKARIASRSWGDRLACKWNFLIPGLPEAVEVHIGRLGQTGEQVSVASSLLKRSRTIEICDRMFRVASISDRLMIATLQRMYRHFYFRLCDIVDTAAIADGGAIDYLRLRIMAIEAGIWEGVATYLGVISDWVTSYRGRDLDLPDFVTSAARFGGERIYYERGFLRVPIVPQSAKLYGKQLAGVLGRGELHNSMRLGLLPWLATAAAIGQKITGSDKGIW
jgi:hypothetical protein